MIAISSATVRQLDGSAATQRTGSLRRIDDILAELLAGYASAVIKPQPAAAESVAPAQGAAQPEPMIGALAPLPTVSLPSVSLPADVTACCVPAGQ